VQTKDIVAALRVLRPGSSWRLPTNGGVADLQWEDPVAAAPTADEISRQHLLNYADAKRDALAAAGLVVDGVKVSTDSTALILLQGAYTLAVANPSMTFQWVQPDGVAVQLNAAQIGDIFHAVTSFVQGTFALQATAIAGITGGATTITSQIDDVMHL
jgi:hypothetical protein